ncbi:MAG: 16S rRNA (cytosine(1402)-N(4))-methyltransferase RsmH [Candidatus Krumholzibacteria bacterium]|nr:16S rRNA (cytosine(1402)-N(4))-methyltransferase RsmH [Candidatus Krumholzibacteria bacterium]
MTGREGKYIDGTVGMGGHAEAILSAGGKGVQLVGIDRDPKALAIAADRLERFGDRVTLVRGNFSEISDHLSGGKCEGVFLDLGLSSLQIADRDRGFSYLADGPLDMAMGPDDGDVEQLLNTVSEGELADIIYQYGEERRSRAIARAIVGERSGGRIEGTSRLRAAIERVAPAKDTISTLARVFQALRIWANGELDALRTFLPAALELCSPGGRLVLISYHSLEDRIVKRFFKTEEKGCICPPDFPECACGKQPRLRVLTRRPVVPGEEEISDNPRARSARLRAAERLA